MAKEHLRSSLCALDRMVKMMLRGWRITRMRDAARFICAGFVVAVTLPHLAAKAEAVEIPSWLRVQPGTHALIKDARSCPSSGQLRQTSTTKSSVSRCSRWLGVRRVVIVSVEPWDTLLHVMPEYIVHVRQIGSRASAYVSSVSLSPIVPRGTTLCTQKQNHDTFVLVKVRVVADPILPLTVDRGRPITVVDLGSGRRRDILSQNLFFDGHSIAYFVDRAWNHQMLSKSFEQQLMDCHGTLHN